MSPVPAATPNPSWNRRRMAAAKYKPNRVRLLLVAESPTTDPERWFYFDDPAHADLLFEEVASVLFEEKPAERREPFLKELRRRGVYLVELKPDAPRDGEPLAPYVGPLVLNLGTLAPEAIVLLTPAVYEAAHRELKKAGLPVVDAQVPSLAVGHETEFRRLFRQAIVRSGLEKLIRPLPAAKREA